MEWHWNYFNTSKLLWVELNFQQKNLIILDFWPSKDKSQATEDKTTTKAKSKTQTKKSHYRHQQNTDCIESLNCSIKIKNTCTFKRNQQTSDTPERGSIRETRFVAESHLSWESSRILDKKYKFLDSSPPEWEILGRRHWKPKFLASVWGPCHITWWWPICNITSSGNLETWNTRLCPRPAESRCTI